jgi:undecaprenyl-diphosphatase
VSGLTYLEAVVVGAFQGVTELFPVSSLGHSILVPALIGGQWAADLNVSAPESPYLAFIVGLHVATAAALLLFFWRDWVRILGGFVTSLRYRRVRTPAERLAWLIVVGTIPVGLAGLLLEHLFRTVLGKPVPAAGFLVVNGLILLAGDRLRRRAETPPAVPAGGTVQPTHKVPMPARSATATWTISGQLDDDTRTGPAEADKDADRDADERLARMSWGRGLLIGASQVLALLPGISRSGATMVAGLARGLSHEDAARFSFLLATPVILAAGVLKLPDLFGPLGAGIGGQVLAGSAASFVAAYLAVRFLTRYFQTRTLKPFAIYCIVAGLGSLIVLSVLR